MESAYKIPDGLPCILQCSGGRTSGYMLIKVIEANPILPNNFHVLFQNTGREMPETLDYVRDLEIYTGQKITWLEYRNEHPFFEVVGHNSASRNGEPFEALIRKRKYVPNVVTRYCSDVLKYRTAKRYLVSLGYKKWTSTIGFRADEMHRVEKIKSRKHSREVIWTPLADAMVTKRIIKDYWDASPYDLKLQNVKGSTPLGNCDGCFLKSEKNLANLCKKFPQRAAWWEKMESETGTSFTKDRYWKDLRINVQNQGSFAFDEQSEVFCTTSFGGCHEY